MPPTTHQSRMGNGSVGLDSSLAECPLVPANFAIPADEPEIVGVRCNSQPTGAYPTQKWSETE